MFDIATGPSLKDLVTETDLWSVLKTRTGGDQWSTAFGLESISIPGDTTTTATIDVGETVYETLEFIGDHDWFRLDLDAGEAVAISLYGSDHTTGNGYGALEDPYLRIYDSDGNFVTSNDDYYYLDSFLEFAPASGGTYFVDVGGYADSYTGDYVLNVTAVEIPEDVIPGDETTTYSLSPYYDYYQSSIEYAGDTDWFAMDVAALTTVRIYMSGWDHTGGNGLSWLETPEINIYDSAGDLVASASDPYGYAYLSFDSLSGGTYYVEATSSDGSLGDYDLYTEASTRVYEGEIGINEKVRGTIETWDSSDLYGIVLTAGDTVRIALTGRDHDPFNGYPELYDPELIIYDGAGNQVAYNDDRPIANTLDSALFFTADTSGTYYIEARYLYGYGDGDYVLAVRDAVDQARLNDEMNDMGDTLVFADSILG